ncbi:Oxidoreductase [Hibiscus syriacus]|uniref:Oxidoreductase n=1 Tax=Hibiscus syriacus TaxID=106335 RepID=A0A6A2ZB09_HIBSY|nr:Oxidoreductase [Hibiscus syriacus]
MSMAAGVASPRERAQALGSAVVPVMQAVPAVADVLAKDTIISWFRGEFAAANAIIDALCGHLSQLQGGGDGGSEYEAVFAAIHRRRLNWIPVLQMQKYHSIADVSAELKKVAAKKTGGGEETVKEEVKGGYGGGDEGCLDDEKEKIAEKMEENEEVGGEEEKDSPDSDITDSGSQEVQHVDENIDICSNHEECEARPSQIKLTKGFSAKEHVKGHMVNIVKGLKLYEDVFTDSQLAKLGDFMSELRSAGQNGELSVDIEPIPALLQSQPVTTLLLSESTMAFGRTLTSDGEGNYRGPLQLSPKEGSLLVMRGNSSDSARHVMCPSPNKRVSITFFRVRSDTNQAQSPPTTSQSGAMALWQPAVPGPYAMSNGSLNGYEALDTMPKWGVLRAPVVMLAPVHPVVVSPRKLPHGGTGVFLPWTMGGSKKHTKHLPPRAQKGRMPALPSPVETQVAESTSEPCINVEGNSV